MYAYYIPVFTQGSFGKVKLALNTKTNVQVAIKIVEKKTIADVEDVSRVYRETFILTSLKHGNIIKLFEVIDTPKSIMLAMEYAGGGELLAYMQKQARLSEVGLQTRVDTPEYGFGYGYEYGYDYEHVGMRVCRDGKVRVEMRASR